MPFCEQCGARLAEGASTCPSCGHADAPGPGAAPPPPPPGYSLRSEPARPPRPAPRPAVPGPAVPGPVAPAIARGFPGPAIPPLAAAVALTVTTAYAIVYTLIDVGSIFSPDTFLTGAAPAVLGSPFTGYYSFDEWLEYAPFGGGWVISIPFVALILTTGLLSSRTNTGVGGRLAIGGLVFVPTVAFTIFLTLLNYAFAGGEYYDSFGAVLARGVAGAALVGLFGGLLGALLSLAIKPPPRSTGFG